MKRKFSRKNLFTEPYRLFWALLFVTAFGAIGVTLLLQSHAQPTCTLTSNDVNPCRPWFGAAVGGYPGVSNAQGAQVAHQESLIGHKMDIQRDYINAPTSDTTAGQEERVPLSGSVGKNEDYFASKGYALNINWNPAQKFLDAESTANGGTANVNSRINQAAANFVNFQQQYPNVKVFMTPWHEINLHTTVGATSCNPKANWAPSYGTSAQFVGAWQNIYNIFKAHGVHDVLWTLGYSSQGAFTCAVPYDWPGSQYVDWINYDSYDHNYNPNNPNSNNTWAKTIGTFYDVLKNVPGTIGQQINSKPWGVGEFGTGKNTDETNMLNYWNDGAAAIKNNTYPKLKMYLIFADYVSHTNIGALTDYDSDGTLDNQKQAAVNNLVDAIYGSTSRPPTPTLTLTPASSTTVSGSSVPVSTSANVSSGAITSLVLKLGSTVLKTCTNTASCSDTWNTTALANGNYTLSATATASGGGSKSVSHTVTVSNVTQVAISPPTNITSSSQTTTSITLSWHAAQDSGYPASQLTYHIYRNGSSVGSTAAGTTSYTDTKLTPGTYYSYTIRTTDPGGHKSVLSPPFTQNTKTPNCAKPKAPAGLTGSATSATAVSLSWQAVANPSKTCTVSHYVVERDGVAVGQPTATSYQDSGLTATTKYTYSVLAVLAGNISGNAATVSVTTQKAKQPDPGPTPPTHLAAAAASNTQINLTWSPSSDTVTGIKQYNVFRNGTQVGHTTATSFGDTGLKPHTAYTYQVKAVSGGNKVASSATVQATTLDTLPPTTPAKVHSPSQTATSIALAWQGSTDPVYASNTLRYQVTRNGHPAGTTAAGTTSYTDSRLAPGTYYSYTVSANDPSGNTSAPSQPFQQITKKVCPSAPAAPQGLRASATAATAVSLSWQAVPPPSSSCRIAHYVIERNGVAIANPTTPTYTDHNLTASSTYRYAVLAVTSDNTAGAASATVQVTTPRAVDTTPPSPPAHLTALAVNGSQINLAWHPSSDPQSGIKQYTVFRNGRSVGTVGQSGTPSFGDSGLTPGTTYAYRIVAVNGVGLTTASATADGTTLARTSPTIPGGTATTGGSQPTTSPLLVGTKSVGSGSDTGQSTSQNPTAVGTTTPILTTPTTTPTHTSTLRRVAYIGGSLLVAMFIIGGIALRFVWWRRQQESPNSDPDLYAATVVRPDHTNNTNDDKEN